MSVSLPSRETLLGGWEEGPVELRCPRHLHGKLTSRWIEVKCSQCGAFHRFDRLTGEMVEEDEGGANGRSRPGGRNRRLAAGLARSR